MVALAHRAGPRGSSRDHQRLSEGGRHRAAWSWPAERIESKTVISAEVSTTPGPPNPATRAEVSTDPAFPIHPGRSPSASACEPYREICGRGSPDAQREYSDG